MNFPDDDPVLSQPERDICERAANEGIPIQAIGRILRVPYEAVSHTLKFAIGQGRVTDMPRADWPPNARWEQRMRSQPPVAPQDLEFACCKFFRLTPLEVGFIAALLRRAFADKINLHGVIETQRAKRSTRPDAESTDPKMVDVMICKLRKKLEDKGFPGAIKTIWGKGYFIEPDIKRAILKAIGLETDHAVEPGDQRAGVAAASA